MRLTVYVLGDLVTHSIEFKAILPAKIMVNPIKLKAII